jgi:bifunctional DNA-binding transcriptional regulator/antitoxin component of YhaV-PrlF toxin-antitoxin module
MPQLEKGGKHTYGWSRVGEGGRIAIPPEALAEYRLQESKKLIMIPGSRTSGGFGLASLKSVKRSSIGAVVNVHPELGEYRVAEGEVVEHKGKSFCRVDLNNGGVVIPPETLERYGVRIGNKLLVIRGSGLAIGFAARGPIVEEAEKHSELEEI